MDPLYIAGPQNVPADLTQPTRAYKTNAWLAMGGLALFIVAYFALTGWFAWTAYRLLDNIARSEQPLATLLTGVCAGFLAVLLGKALFFVKHRFDIDMPEVTRKQEPQLFAFLDRLADEAHAPRPHRVYLASDVNASVFYDLSILNLIFPSRKNLIIGLPLVNGLTLGEIKAVLSHEFGHFAQRSMAVGRWVYIAQQIAGQVIARRDALDGFLRGLSRSDIRIAWVGWLLSIAVWSVRSLMETLFSVVTLAERALSREMEFQADMIAVSLTGSDALIHALHRLHAVEDAWQRTLRFADHQARAGHAVSDIFALQSQIMQRFREILDDPHFGASPTVPAERPEEYRVFKTPLAQPPKMWSTHPANCDRESNAKRTYIASPIDERSAWELFSDPATLRQQHTSYMLRNVKEAQVLELGESLQRLEKVYARAYYDRNYRGAYLGRDMLRQVRAAADLYEVPPQASIERELAACYPESLAEDLVRQRDLEAEHEALVALREGVAKAPGGVIRHRGRELKRRELTRTIEEVARELAAARGVIHEHDRRCRGAHLAAATQIGAGWDAYLKGLLEILHYAEHSDANVLDAQGALHHAIGVASADGRISQSEREYLVVACADVHSALRHVYDDEGRHIVLDPELAKALGADGWLQYLGEFNLPPPNEDNLGQWIDAIGSWVASCSSDLESLRYAALERLLLAESYVARCWRGQEAVVAAPPATVVPKHYPLMLEGQERVRKQKLDLWDRFYSADGLGFTLARVVVACGIVATVVTFSTSGVATGVTAPLVPDVSFRAASGEPVVSVYNGLAREVRVTIGTQTLDVKPATSVQQAMPASSQYQVRTTTLDGRLIEAFDVDVSEVGKYVYNVASASPLEEWSITLGGQESSDTKQLGSPRWLRTDANYVFMEDVPERLSSSRKAIRTVLVGIADRRPSDMLAAIPAEKQADLITIQARWADSGSVTGADWLQSAFARGDLPVTAERLEQDPNDPLLLTLERQFAPKGTKDEVCARHQDMARRQPDNIDLQFVGANCIKDGKQRRQAMLALRRRDPNNGWVARAVGYDHAQRAEWTEAIAALRVTVDTVPVLAENTAVDLGRILRLTQGQGNVPLQALVAKSSRLNFYVGLEVGRSVNDIDSAYHRLADGRIDAAVAVQVESQRAMNRVLLLAAASDGAKLELTERALALPCVGLDTSEAWVALGLVRREGRDDAACVKTVTEAGGEEVDKILRFLAAAQTPSEAEPLLQGLDPEARGFAYSTAVIILGERAPDDWSWNAKQLLYVVERPWFAALAPPRKADPNRTPPKLLRY